MIDGGLSDSTFSLIIITTLLGLAPMALLLMTAFVKISVVFFIVRNAIGLQQTPANLVLSGIATILALYISAPVLNQTYGELRAPDTRYETIEDWENALLRGTEPVRKFLHTHTTEVERAFFTTAAKQVWQDQEAVQLSEDSIFVLIPAFMMHELTAAFKIGLMIYIPFLAIDLIVANILMALGMMMMSPTVVGVPFKLLLFVAIDGWNMLIRGLILSYAVG